MYACTLSKVIFIGVAVLYEVSVPTEDRKQPKEMIMRLYGQRGISRLTKLRLEKSQSESVQYLAFNVSYIFLFAGQ